MRREIVLASWIVLDHPDSATAFPSVGANSATVEFQRVYWQCLAVFFLTARVHNPGVSLMLYANVDVAHAAPSEILAAMQALGVLFRKLDITFRLSHGSVERWGNQSVGHPNSVRVA